MAELNIIKCDRCPAISEPYEGNRPDDWHYRNIGMGDWFFCPACHKTWEKILSDAAKAKRLAVMEFLGDLFDAESWKLLEEGRLNEWTLKREKEEIERKLRGIELLLDPLPRCPTCKGTGCKQYSRKGAGDCPTCKGNGYDLAPTLEGS